MYDLVNVFFRYTLLVGRPPFETSCLKDTYMRIRNNEYAIPSRVSRSAANLIQKLLSERPEDRPSLSSLFNDSFFTKGFFPRSLPTMCCMTPPKFSSNSHSRYSRTKRQDSYKPSDTRDSALSKSPCGSDDGVRQLKSAFSSLNFHEGSKLNDLRKKEQVESGVESQDSNGHEISNSLGKIYLISHFSILHKFFPYFWVGKFGRNYACFQFFKEKIIGITFYNTTKFTFDNISFYVLYLRINNSFMADIVQLHTKTFKCFLSTVFVQRLKISLM